MSVSKNLYTGLHISFSTVNWIHCENFDIKLLQWSMSLRRHTSVYVFAEKLLLVSWFLFRNKTTDQKACVLLPIQFSSLFSSLFLTLCWVREVIQNHTEASILVGFPIWRGPMTTMAVALDRNLFSAYYSSLISILQRQSWGLGVATSRFSCTLYRKYVRKWVLLKRNRIICPEVAVNDQFLPGKSKFLGNCQKKLKFFKNLPVRNGIFCVKLPEKIEFCMAKWKFFDQDPRPPDFKPDWRHWNQRELSNGDPNPVQPAWSGLRISCFDISTSGSVWPK